MKLTFASRNKNKFREIEKMIPNKFELGNLSDLNYFDEIPENEDSIEGNAAYKANFIHSKFNINVFADDTGLEVESLNGRPGVHSARFAGIECDAEKNIDKLLFELKKVENRKARFKTVIALIINNKFYQFEGIINGEILIRPMMYLALSYDHRIIDGKDSVSFLKYIKENLEDPRRLFLDL